MMRHYLIAMAGAQLVAALLISAPLLAAAAPPAPAAPAAASQPKTAPEPVPRSEAGLNPGLVYPELVLSEDTVWRGEVLVEGALTVAPQATLTVEPGTVVRFRRKGAQTPSLVVQGRIVAAGTKETPVLFTSNFAVPAPSDWQGIMLLGSEKKNLLENCRIQGAQTGLEALFSSVTLKNVRVERSATGMRFQDTLLAMEAGGVSDCDTGLSFAESEATLRGIAVEGNRLGVVAKRSSLYLFEPSLAGNQAAAFSGAECRVRIQGGVVAGNGSGVTFLECQGAVSGAKVAKNREFGMSLTASRIRVHGNQITGNGNNGVIVFDGSSVAWDNAIHENAGYDLYNAGTEEFRAPGNWWGALGPKIFDNAGRGKVLYAPQLNDRPQPQ